MDSEAKPYLTIAITNSCNFRCGYCSPTEKGGFGEGFGTENQKPDLEDLEEKVLIAEEEGITKVRITGGEPLVVKGIMDLLTFFENKTSLEYALATNGSLVGKHIDALSDLSRLDLRISLDTLHEQKFNEICGVEGQYKIVMDNIHALTDVGILKRVAMVVTSENVDEVESMIDFCEELGINLKLFDMYATSATLELWKNMYSPLDKAREIVESRSTTARQVTYTKNFGIPSLEYETKAGIIVRIKDSTAGTKYSQEFCGDCNALPCQEGLYTVLYSPNKKLIPCRLSPAHFEAETPEQFRTSLKKLINIFQQSHHENRFWSGMYG
ncbi:radical SAM protein [archaeon]|nr:radical SAM protein [archaeon]MBL7057186.1 radical SAM protein [Candidatus Woesearchaeota archaeon]